MVRRRIFRRWVGLVDAAASGSVPAFPAGNLDWLVAFLQQIISPEDYQKYKSSFEPSPAKEEVPLAVELANKTKERGTVMGCVEHYRNVCRDLETMLMKESEKFDEAVERKSALEARIAEKESPPVVQEAFPPPPEEENEEDTQMENEAPDTGAGVGDFVSPSKKKVIKSPFRKRASLRLMETRSSVFAKLSKLSSQELLKLSEQCSALAKDCDPDLSMDEPALPATEEDDAQGTQLEKFFATQKLRKRRRHPFLNCVVQIPTGLRQPKNAVHTLDPFSRPEFLNKGAEPQTVKQCAPKCAQRDSVGDVMLYATVGCGALLVETALLYVMVCRSCLLLLAEIVMHHALVGCGTLPPLEETRWSSLFNG